MREERSELLSPLKYHNFVKPHNTLADYTNIGDEWPFQDYPIPISIFYEEEKQSHQAK